MDPGFRDAQPGLQLACLHQPLERREVALDLATAHARERHRRQARHRAGASVDLGVHFGTELRRFEPNASFEREWSAGNREGMEFRRPDFQHLEIYTEFGSEQTQRTAVASPGARRSRRKLAPFDDRRLPAHVVFMSDQNAIAVLDSTAD